MMLSATVQFSACGLLWTAEIANRGENEVPDVGRLLLSMDRPAPAKMGLLIMCAADARGLPVHRRVLGALLEPGTATMTLVRSAAASAVVRAALSILNGPTEGEVPLTPALARDGQAALDEWLPMNVPQG